jgi:hypothetical protein
MEIDLMLDVVGELSELTEPETPETTRGSVTVSVSIRLAGGGTVPFSSEARLSSSLLAIDFSVCEAEDSDGGLVETSNGGRKISTGVDRGGNGGGTGRGDTGGEKLADTGTRTSRSLSPETPSAFWDESCDCGIVCGEVRC